MHTSLAQRQVVLLCVRLAALEILVRHGALPFDEYQVGDDVSRCWVSLGRAAHRLAEDPRLRSLALPGELLDPQAFAGPAPESLPVALAYARLEPGADPAGLGMLYERLAAGANANGRHYTPPAVAAELASRTIGRGAPGVILTVCDPAMGCGQFLLAALDAAGPARRAQAMALYGVELDPGAAMIARAAVGLALLDDSEPLPDLRERLRAGDALLNVDGQSDDDPLDGWWRVFAEVGAAGGFDVVLGNPPYIDSERMAREQPETRRALVRRWPTARGNWDLFVPFVELGLRLTRAGGRCALLVPNRLLGADYAAALRALLAEQTIEALIDYSRDNLFAAQVYPVAFVARRARPAPESPQRRLGRASWWPLLSPYAALIERCVRGASTLADLAEVREAATVAEAYALAPLIEELPDETLPAGMLRVVNTGMLDRYATQWGTRPMRYLGRSYLRPAVRIARIEAVPALRLPDGRPRIILAGLARRPEAYADPDGTLLAAKSTVVVTPESADLWALLGLLNSRLVALLYREFYGGLALRGGYLRVGARQLARLPVPAVLPAELGELARRRAALGPGEQSAELERRIDELVERLYGVA